MKTGLRILLDPAAADGGSTPPPVPPPPPAPEVKIEPAEKTVQLSASEYLELRRQLDEAKRLREASEVKAREEAEQLQKEALEKIAAEKGLAEALAIAKQQAEERLTAESALRSKAEQRLVQREASSAARSQFAEFLAARVEGVAKGEDAIEARERGGTKTAAELAAAMTSSPEYAHFFEAQAKGGSGSTGTDATPRAESEPGRTKTAGELELERLIAERKANAGRKTAGWMTGG
jgi:colicin import membrane protein